MTKDQHTTPETRNTTAAGNAGDQSVFCFGEMLLRMSPSLNRAWLHEAKMPVYIGGAELNVATALALWKLPAQYCTALPKNYLSEEICTELRSKNIDVSPIHFSGNRIGVYYLPQGADLKHAGVIYDRAHSAFAELQTGMIDWDKVLQGVSWFHFSAISPALNEQVVAVCREGLEAASKKGITISVDLNYRAKLWQYGKSPVDIMPLLVQYCDVVMGNIWAANTLLGIPVSADLNENTSKETYLEHAVATSKAIRKNFPRCKIIANTFRFDHGEGGILYYTALYTGDTLYQSPQFTSARIVDKVGSGDCFMAGLIYGLYQQHTPQNVIDFAAAAAFGKLHETGDTTSQDVDTIKKRISQHG